MNTVTLAVFGIVLGAVVSGFVLGALWQTRREFPGDFLPAGLGARWQAFTFKRRERAAARRLRALEKRGARRIA